ncbi:MAG: hypothetical protein A3G33_08820 [Omnitrophica bacterium RIFCSPLOWO2_12_FULL_44_17]|uniref:NAD kinase n=1 Tax=Candidatus Danuiimicrobium aquiferis TaxID=1801832 RepID=A0A1G1L1B4_9BACT|nr:MAG: hypothetical protein A3B72_08160 [Omnitrophica bacterium RIFCSPHIGHO2_02_FULL_45_28]OGW88519.1 MAG: hypothetical protein A3E74_06630 [Omnitrophica bacterium RIFCSPHIGHO2_12_FULL_44_12]OGW98945.1 MAG: hypothetical protein A3G33_08820 [Omnitrophica bacterium RIFCSPLOWO2_12_FULL_44_17]OGX01782.1 MAG: hypothetical protein A3J12_04945 [Omnitrophica bacterium RIFCSPLOWO2_02_FULL_44_11]
MQQVAIYTNLSRPKADEARLRLCEWLAKRNIAIKELDEVFQESDIADADLIISLGGDGTILRLVSKMIRPAIPVLGVNLGSLGFITEVREEELYDELKSILLGQYEVEERMLLSATVRFGEGVENRGLERRLQALNDIVVNREGLTRYMHVQVEVGGETAIAFYGDGVIIATPTGSTAYSLSAGGSIVHPSLDNMMITPICAHTSASRSLVVSGNQVVKIRIRCDSDKEKALLSADGQVDLAIDHETVVEITKAENRFLLVKSSKRSYFGTLREKFNFPG